MSRLQEYNREFGVVFDDDETPADRWARLNGIPITPGGGGKPTTTTQPTNTNSTQTYAQQNYQQNLNQPGYATRDQLAAAGGRQLNANTIQTPDGARYTLDSLSGGLYRASGAALGTKQDVQAWANAKPLGGALATAGPTTTGGTYTPSATTPTATGGFQPNDFAALNPSSGATIPGLDPFVGPTPPGGISSAGRHDLYGSQGNTDLNTIYGGHQGSASGNFPTTPGFRTEGQYGNSINFAGGGGPGGSGGSSSGGRIEPQNLLPGVQVNVPDTYVRDQGNSGADNRAYQVPFNIGPNSTAGLMNVGGNNVQIQSADRSQGMGYALNAAPASNVFALTGRQGSADPATQAAQILQLQTAIQDGKLASLMEPNQNQFGGYHAGTGNGFFSGNGGQAQTNLWNTANPTAPAPAPPPAAYPGWYTNPATGGPAISPTNPGSLSAIGNIWSGGGNLNGHPPDTASVLNPQTQAPGQGNPTIQAGMNGTPNVAAPQTQAQQQAQSYAAAVAAIQDQRDRAEGSYGDYYGGGGPDGGQRGFAKGGSVTALDPFGGMQHYAAGGSMTTTEPIVGIGVYSGQRKFIVGEDGTGDGRPDAERLSFPSPNQLQITPLHHTATFAGGGTVQAQGPTPFSNEWYLQQIREQEAKAKEQRPIDWGGVYSISPQLAGGGAYAQQQQAMAPPPLVRIDPGGINMPTFATGGSVTIDPMQQPRAVTAPPPAQDTAAPPSSTPPVTAGNNSNVPPGFDPLDPAALAPWQKAQQQLGYQQHLRDTIDNPRRQAGGLGGSTGVAVLQGDTPAANLGAGVYYDQRPQVQNMVDQIIGNRANLNALGPKEDIEPIIGQVSQLGIQLDTQQKLRDLATSRVAADAQDQVAKQQAVGKLGYLQADLVATQNALANAQNNVEYDPDPAARIQHIYDLAAKLAGIQGDITATNNLINGPGPALQAIDAEIGSLQNSLPQGFNEAEAKTQLALLNQRVSNQTKREQLTQQSYNLSKMGVPNLSAPLIPLNPLAPAHATTPAFAKGGKVTVKKPRSRSVKLPSGKKLTIEEAD